MLMQPRDAPRTLLTRALSLFRLAAPLFAAFALLVAHGADAQQRSRPARLGILSPFAPHEPAFETFRRELLDLGYREGENLIIDERWAAGDLALLPSLAMELARLQPDVIFAGGEQGLSAIKSASRNIPVVVVTCDPVDQLIRSLAAPGGNATGLSCVSAELAGKRIEMLKELIPNLARAAVLYNPA